MLRLVLPKGSLERATLELFAAADLARHPVLRRRLPGDHRRPPDRRGPDPAARRRSRSTWPTGCSTSGSPAGTGWRSGGATVTSLGVLRYSKATANPIRVVLAVPVDSPVVVGGRSGRHRGPAPAGALAGVDRVPRADPPVSRGARGARPRSASPTGPPRPRCPTSPTAWSRSPRPDGPCGPPASRSSRPCSSPTPS